MLTKGNFLKYKHRAWLIACHRKEKSSRHVDRIKAILYLDSGISPAEVTELLFMDDDTVWRYFATFMSHGLGALLSDGYQPYQGNLSDNETERLCAFRLSEGSLSVAPFIAFIQVEFGKECTVSGAASLSHSMGFVYKKPEGIPGKAAPERQRVFVAEFWKFMATKSRDDQVWFVDGAHPPHNFLLAYGWFTKGEKVSVPANVGRAGVNVNGAINFAIREAAHVVCDSVNAQSMVELLHEIERQAPMWGQDSRVLRQREVLPLVGGARVFGEVTGGTVPPAVLAEPEPHRAAVALHAEYGVLHRYHGTLGGVMDAMLDFFARLADKYCGQLKSFITTHFHVIPPPCEGEGDRLRVIPVYLFTTCIIHR